jgi:hypothetical protein
LFYLDTRSEFPAFVGVFTNKPEGNIEQTGRVILSNQIAPELVGDKPTRAMGFSIFLEL